MNKQQAEELIDLLKSSLSDYLIDSLTFRTTYELKLNNKVYEVLIYPKTTPIFTKVELNILFPLLKEQLYFIESCGSFPRIKIY